MPNHVINILRFDGPADAIAALRDTIAITAQYADEDIGSNCGTVRYRATEHPLATGPIDPYAFARELWGRDDEPDESEDE